MRSHFHKAPTVSHSELSDYVSYVTGRKVYTTEEINAMTYDEMDALHDQPMNVRLETGEVRDLNNDPNGEVEILYGAGWAITGFRKS